jgi:apolipoprotein N-acyltransferase
MNERRPLLPPVLAWTGAALSGVLYWIAFAGFDVWPLAFFAFGPLWLAVRGQTPKRALLLGALAGTTMNVLGFYWLLGMLRAFSGFPTVACMFFVLVVCSYQGLRVGMLGWLYARAEMRGWPRVPAFLAAFVASELVGGLLMLFPWYFAATVHQIPALIQVAELGGPILVGLVLLVSGLAIFEPVLARVERRKVDGRVLLAGALTLGFALLYGFVRIPRVDELTAAAPEAKVGLVQGNMGLFAKRIETRTGLARHIDSTVRLRRAGVDFVVWSESSVMSAIDQAQMAQLVPQYFARSLRIPAIFGAVLFDRASGDMFNVALSTDVDGTVTGRYDKEYLLQFGEHLPLSEYFPILHKWSPNSGRFTPGTKLDPLLVKLDGGTHKVGVLICYEDIIPAFTNALVRATEPELLVNMTNDAWFGATTEPWEHMALAQLRAVEHRRYLVRSTNSGVSAVVDPVGRVVTHGEVRDVQDGSFEKPDELTATIRWMNGKRTVYELLGDSLWWIASVAAFAMAFRSRPLALARGASA